MALGLNSATETTSLGQPLSFAATLHPSGGGTIQSSCVQAKVAIGGRPLPAQWVRVRLQPPVEGTSGQRLTVVTTVAVNEPVVAIDLQVGCPVQLSRSFVVFADPAAQRAYAARKAAGAEGSAPPMTVPQAPAWSGRPESSLPGRVQTASLEIGKDAVPAGWSAIELRARDGLPAGATDDILGSGAGPDEPSRVEALDAALQQLRAEHAATQRQLNQMAERLREAERHRAGSPVVSVFALLFALAATTLAGLAWLRRQTDSENDTHWSISTQEDSVMPALAVISEGEEAGAPPALPQPAKRPAPAGAVRETPVTTQPTPLEPIAAPEPPPPEPPVEVPYAPRRPMSADELIDLEQQAEFFIVLGQDDAAIDLLMAHVRSTGGVSPMPYLKLLEIYRRRGERDAFDRIRERFNRRFNAYAPEWEIDPEEGLGLEGYPQVIKRLQNAWASPSLTLDVLDAAMFRRDAGPAFDIPAYRELLFLYSLARDIAEHQAANAAIDLLLPLGEEVVALRPIASAAIARAQPARPVIDLDVSNDRPPLGFSPSGPSTRY